MIERHMPDSGVDTARNFEDALALVVAHGCYDVTLLDLNMPGMQRFEGLRRMVAQCPDSAVAIITGMVGADMAGEALKAGAKGFIPKTLSGTRLLAAIRQLAAGEIYAPQDLLKPGAMQDA